MQPRHFVLVFVGHQLVQLACHGFAEHGLAQWGFGLLNTLHKGLIACGIGRILVVGEAANTVVDEVLQRLALFELDHLRRLQALHQHAQLMGRMAAPLKSRQVVAHLHIVEFNGPNQRFAAQRHPAFLPSKAQDHGVHINRVTHELFGQGVGIKTADALHPHLFCDGGHTGFGGVLPVAVFHKGSGGRAVAVEGHMGAAFAHAQGGFFGGTHDRVAADDQVCSGHTHTGGANLILPIRHQHMAPRGAALLRQTR